MLRKFGAKKFWADRQGNFAIMTTIAAVPLLGGLALGIDYSEMTRQYQTMQSALDASALASAKMVTEGKDETSVKTFARDFFLANMTGINASNATIEVTVPSSSTGGGKLKMSAKMTYKPYFMDGFSKLLGQSATVVPLSAVTEVRLKNTIEVALVLDNSGSMDFAGKNSSKKRMQLLKDAAKELIDTMAGQAKGMTQVKAPVRFAVVPFAASVNVGADNKDAAWMDVTGVSPLHNENINWKSIPDAKGNTWSIEQVGNAWYARGSAWSAYDLKDKALTRFALFDNILKRVTGKDSKGNNLTGPFASWAGCVEARPYPLNINDTTPSSSNAKSLFVPMMAPDEYDPLFYGGRTYQSLNNWWYEGVADRSFTTTAEYQRRQRDAVKFLTPFPLNPDPNLSMTGDPNDSCTTKAITPLTDVTVKAGADSIKTAIDAMQPLGATNVIEGLAWGWRTLSSASPFTEGRAETERGNDKVVIVLTDGANTYYSPSSLGSYDAAQNMSAYSAYGYTATKYEGGDTRLFRDPSGGFSKTDYSNENYSKAMNAQFASLCKDSTFIRASGDGTTLGKITVMTIALDLDASDAEEKAQIAALKACASPSRVSGDKVLFWNATGATLGLVFKDIANELSNLRIVG